MLCETKQQIYQLFIDLNEPNLCKYPGLTEKFLLKIYVQLLYNIENKIEREFSKEALDIFNLMKDDPLHHDPHSFTCSGKPLHSIEVCF
ncbi:MAG: hypothetical protein GF311_23690 [Candidatus Lokiarchaeota archaeon]|nr:hypothetical protein [Candidatus Lokiarchaeota archaeon]